MLKIGSPFGIFSEEPNLKTQIELSRLEQIDELINIELTGGHISIAGRDFENNKIIIFPENPHIFNFNGVDYRGKIKLIVHPDGSSFDVINLVPPESYLAGVAGAEMPDYWEPEALKAQVIAARTYCFFIKKRFGVNRDWDVSKTAAHQVYNGLSAESKAVWDAVNQTTGMVLTCSQDGGSEEIFPAYYSSTCGGHTENSKNVFGDSYGPLVGVACPYCREVAKPKYFFWPMVQVDNNEVSAKLLQKYPALNQLGDIKDVTIAEKSEFGEFSRITKIKLTGSNGSSDFLRGEDFRLTLDSTGNKLKSTACRFEKWDNTWVFLEGRGWGHGVGMCQCGAEGMARQGKTAQEILFHYYPGSKIISINYDE